MEESDVERQFVKERQESPVSQCSQKARFSIIIWSLSETWSMAPVSILFFLIVNHDSIFSFARTNAMLYSVSSVRPEVIGRLDWWRSLALRGSSSLEKNEWKVQRSGRWSWWINPQGKTDIELSTTFHFNHNCDFWGISFYWVPFQYFSLKLSFNFHSWVFTCQSLLKPASLFRNQMIHKFRLLKYENVPLRGVPNRSQRSYI